MEKELTANHTKTNTLIAAKTADGGSSPENVARQFVESVSNSTFPFAYFEHFAVSTMGFYLVIATLAFEIYSPCLRWRQLHGKGK